MELDSQVAFELSVPITYAIVVYRDSTFSIHISYNFYSMKEKSKLKYCHFVCKKLQEGLISLHHVSYTNQHADILTKTLIVFKNSVILQKLTVKSYPTNSPMSIHCGFTSFFFA